MLQFFIQPIRVGIPQISAAKKGACILMVFQSAISIFSFFPCFYIFKSILCLKNGSLVYFRLKASSLMFICILDLIGVIL